jgi:hypothetical protein
VVLKHVTQRHQDASRAHAARERLTKQRLLAAYQSPTQQKVWKFLSWPRTQCELMVAGFRGYLFSYSFMHAHRAGSEFATILPADIVHADCGFTDLPGDGLGHHPGPAPENRSDTRQQPRALAVCKFFNAHLSCGPQPPAGWPSPPPCPCQPSCHICLPQDRLGDLNIPHPLHSCMRRRQTCCRSL